MALSFSFAFTKARAAALEGSPLVSNRLHPVVLIFSV
jgi:hypothetical protein